MNKFRIITLLFVLISVNLFSADPPKDSPVAIIMKIINDVTARKNGANWGPAKTGTPLSTTDEVKTGDKSLALIKFTDNSLIRVRENSSLKIYADKDKGQLSKNTYIDKGKVGFNVSKQENEEFRFTTPTMVASIRGTGGYIAVEHDGLSLLVCTEGNIDISATQGQKQTGNLKAGRFAQIGADGTINSGAITPQQDTESKNLKRTNIKRLIINTDSGDLIIEYLGDD
jgi:hypothetical protein